MKWFELKARSHYRSTEHGDVRIELDAGNAPVTTANFLRYVDGGHYDGGTFYRAVSYANDNGNPCGFIFPNMPNCVNISQPASARLCELS